jgi:hypothetical protein
VTDVIAIPSVNPASPDDRSDWDPLAEQVYSAIQRAHACNKPYGSCVKTRLAFAAAGQIWALGKEEVARRLSGVIDIADVDELKRLDKLRRINPERTAAEWTASRIAQINDAIRTILLATQASETAKRRALTIAAAKATPSRALPLKLAAVDLTEDADLRHPEIPIDSAKADMTHVPRQSQRQSRSASKGDGTHVYEELDLDADSEEEPAAEAPLGEAPQDDQTSTKDCTAPVRTPQLTPPRARDAGKLDGTAGPGSRPLASRPASAKKDGGAVRFDMVSPAALRAMITTMAKQETVSGKDCAYLLRQVMDVAETTNRRSEGQAEQLRTLLIQVGKLRSQVDDQATTIKNLSAKPVNTPAAQEPRPALACRISPTLGDGYCMFGSVEKSKLWAIGKAKALIAKVAVKMTVEDRHLAEMGDGSEEAFDTYLEKMLVREYHGGQSELCVLARALKGDTRFVVINTHPESSWAVGSKIRPYYVADVEGVQPTREVLLYRNVSGYPHDLKGGENDGYIFHYDLVAPAITTAGAMLEFEIPQGQTTEEAEQRWRAAQAECRKWKESLQAPTRPTAGKSGPPAGTPASSPPTKSSTHGQQLTGSWASNLAGGKLAGPPARSPGPAGSPQQLKQGKDAQAEGWQGGPKRHFGQQNRSTLHHPKSLGVVIFRLREEGSSPEQILQHAKRMAISLGAVQASDIEIKRNLSANNSFRAVVRVRTQEAVDHIIEQGRAAWQQGHSHWTMEPYHAPLERRFGGHNDGAMGRPHLNNDLAAKAAARR